MSVSKLKAMLVGNFSGHDLAHVDQVIGAAIVAGVNSLSELHAIVAEAIDFQDATNIRPKSTAAPTPTGATCELCGGKMVRYPCAYRGVECVACGHNPARRKINNFGRKS